MSLLISPALNTYVDHRMSKKKKLLKLFQMKKVEIYQVFLMIMGTCTTMDVVGVVIMFYGIILI